MKILVTGGSGGIGKSIVKKFNKAGHVVVAPSRDELDLSKKVILSDIQFDAVINNAGINPLKNITEISDQEVMKVNYDAPLQIIQQCLPYMVKQKFGRIVNIGSIWIEIAKSKRAAYSASKSALHALTQALTAEYADSNILTNTVSPGFIGTDLTYQNNTEQELNGLIKNVPVQRLGQPDEVADLVYYLTVNNNFITGQNIIIDGGYTCIAH